MTHAFIKNLAAEKPDNALKYALLITTLTVSIGVGILMFWMDKTNTEAASLAFAAAQDASIQGNAELALIKLDEAIQHKKQALYFYTKYVILMQQKKYHEAGINLEKAAQQEPGNAGYAFETGYFYIGQGADIQKGLAYLKKAKDLDPKNSDYTLIYGSTVAQYENMNAGINVLERLTKQDPYYSSVWNTLAALYSQVGQPEKALETRIQATQKFPNDAFHWYWLAHQYDQQDNKPKAVEAYKKSIALAPEWGTSAAYRIAALTGDKVPEQYRTIMEEHIPVVYRDTHAYIQASFNGHTGLFLLDTGATESALFKSFLTKNGIDIGENNPTAQYQTANGILSAPIIYSNVQIKTFNLKNMRVAVIPSPQVDEPFDGIIGMNVMKYFNVSMDNLRGTLIFSRK